jgi:hypothetical protein
MTRPKAGGYTHRQLVSQAKRHNRLAGQHINTAIDHTSDLSVLRALGKAQSVLLCQTHELDELDRFSRLKQNADSVSAESAE